MNLEDILVDTLGITSEKAKTILKSRSTKKIVHKDLLILVFKREMLGYPEGTSIIHDTSTSVSRVIPGYPPIPRLLILEKIRDIFKEEVVVEEKINGYNVRVAAIGEKIVSLTRGGNICPYTHYKILQLYGEKLRKLFQDYPDLILCGEAIGMDNPYVRYEGYRNVSFDYIVFDMMQERKFLSIKKRDSMAAEYGLKIPRSYGFYKPEEFRRIIDLSVQLEEKGIEGFVIKSMDNEVRVKYTMTSTNIGDIREGMRFFFEEGRTYIFPRVLREIFRQYELVKNGYDFGEEVYVKLGKALLEPPIETVAKTEKGEISDEDFTLVLDDLRILDEFLQYMEKQKIPIHVIGIYPTSGGEYRISCLKIRRTPLRIKSILDTGISPED
jgi:putative ATP-dependent DNA ligase